LYVLTLTMKLLLALVLVCAFVGRLSAQDLPPPPIDEMPPVVEPSIDELVERAGGCRDVYSGRTCQMYKKRGYCRFSSMKTKCGMTCGACAADAPSSGGSSNAPQNKPYSGKCGSPSVSLRYLFSSRIIGGSDAKYGSIPWQAGIYSSSSNRVFCGGALIDQQHIVTAAHCFAKGRAASKYYIYLGKHHSSYGISDKGMRKMKIAKIIVHAAYDKTTNDNDIAIVKLAKKVTYNTYIRPVCLPRAAHRLYTGRSALVSGFGVTDYATKRTANVLQQVDVKIMDQDTCNNWFTTSTFGRYKVTDNMVCAGHAAGKKDSCQGDSGGPLMITSNGQHYLAGVVSWGIGCGAAAKPGVYVRVHNYLDWIANQTK